MVKDVEDHGVHDFHGFLIDASGFFTGGVFQDLVDVEREGFGFFSAGGANATGGGDLEGFVSFRRDEWTSTTDHVIIDWGVAGYKG